MQIIINQLSLLRQCWWKEPWLQCRYTLLCVVYRRCETCTAAPIPPPLYGFVRSSLGFTALPGRHSRSFLSSSLGFTALPARCDANTKRSWSPLQRINSKSVFIQVCLATKGGPSSNCKCHDHHPSPHHRRHPSRSMSLPLPSDWVSSSSDS